MTAKTETVEVAPNTTISISSEQHEETPINEPQEDSARFSQDVFTVPPSNLLDMPAPATPRQEPSEFGSLEAEAGLLSPASASSSNRTPTQASFRKNSWAHEQLPLTPLQQFRNMPQGQGDAKALPVPPNEMEESTLEAPLPDPSYMETPLAVPAHAAPLPGQEDPDAPRPNTSGPSNATSDADGHDKPQIPTLNTASNSRVAESQPSPRRSEDSEGTFRTAESGESHGLGSEEVPTPLVKDSIRPSIDGSAISEMSNSNETGTFEVEQPIGSFTNRTQPPTNTPRPFSFIQFGEPQRPSEGLSYGPRFEDEIPPQQRQAIPPSPMSPISPRQAQTQKQVQPHDPVQDPQSVEPQTSQVRGDPGAVDQAAPIHHNTLHDFGPQDQSFTKKPRPRSFSRPFQDQFSRIRPEPQADGEAEKRLSAEIASPFYTMQSPTSIAQTPKDQKSDPQPKAQRPSVAGVEPSQKRSRTSGIFKSFSSSPREPSQPENPLAPRKSVDQATPPPLKVDRKSKRGKLLRTLTGRSGSDSNHSKDEVPALPKLQTDFSQEGFSHSNGRRIGPQALEEASTSNRGNKFQRASTSGVVGEDGGKKRRFSGFVSAPNRSSHL